MAQIITESDTDEELRVGFQPRNQVAGKETVYSIESRNGFMKFLRIMCPEKKAFKPIKVKVEYKESPPSSESDSSASSSPFSTPELHPKSMAIPEEAGLMLPAAVKPQKRPRNSDRWVCRTCGQHGHNSNNLKFHPEKRVKKE